jgi:catechol 2,3-dioxygenase-like lactoylglutathione lyase family enzyme
MARDIEHGRLRALAVADPPERWEALGFAVVAESVLLPDLRVVLGAPAFSVSIAGVTEIDGLALGEVAPSAPVYSAHPNGALAVDHVVALTPDFDRTAQRLDAAGIPLRRVRDAGGFRQGFRRLGPTILELVEAPSAPATTWWGLTVTVPDLGALPGTLISDPKPAVQRGRLIATVRTPGTPLAFMTPEAP